MLILASLASLVLVADSPSVRCELTSDPRGRVFVLDREAGGTDPDWRLSLKDHDSGDKWIRLALPGAMPTFENGTAHLSFKNANGGRQVTLDVSPQGATLDVFVDYGLDVNIEPDLDPDVDRMSTGGPITDLSCQVTPAGAR
jgi:hypothetical protein